MAQFETRIQKIDARSAIIAEEVFDMKNNDLARKTRVPVDDGNEEFDHYKWLQAEADALREELVNVKESIRLAKG